MADLNENVKRMLDAGVDREKIKDYVRRHSQESRVQPQQEAAPMSWPDVGKQAVQNIPASAMEYAAALGNAALHPLDTIKGLFQLAKGYNDMTGLVPHEVLPKRQDDTRAFLSFAGTINKRYGTIDNLKKTIAKDPVGVLSDASAVLASGGMVAGAALPKAGAAIRRAGEVAEPLNIARQAVARPAGLLGGGRAAERMITGVLKPSKKTSMFATPEARAALVDTAVREGVVPTVGGMRKLNQRITPLSERVKQIVDAGTDAGGTVSRRAVLERIIPNLERASMEAAPTQGMRQVASVASDFIESHPETMSPARAQQIKSATQSAMRKQYGEMKSATVEANKAIARGLKEELETLYPELKRLNESQKELIGLRNAIEDAIPRLENRNLFSLDTGVKGTLGGVALGPAGAIGAVGAQGILGHPAVKMRLAIALARARKMPNLGTRGAAERAMARFINEDTEEK